MGVSIYDLSSLVQLYAPGGDLNVLMTFLVLGVALAIAAQVLPKHAFPYLNRGFLLAAFLMFVLSGLAEWTSHRLDWADALLLGFLLGGALWVTFPAISTQRSQGDISRKDRTYLSSAAIVFLVMGPFAMTLGGQASEQERDMRFAEALNFLSDGLVNHGDLKVIPASEISRTPVTIRWYAQDDEGLRHQREMLQKLTLGIPNAIFRFRHPDAFAIDDTTEWRIAKVLPRDMFHRFDGKPVQQPIFCFYKSGKLAHVTLRYPGMGFTDLRSIENDAIRPLAAFCPKTFNPDNDPLTSPMITQINETYPVAGTLHRQGKS